MDQAFGVNILWTNKTKVDDFKRCESFHMWSKSVSEKEIIPAVKKVNGE